MPFPPLRPRARLPLRSQTHQQARGPAAERNRDRLAVQFETEPAAEPETANAEFAASLERSFWGPHRSEPVARSNGRWHPATPVSESGIAVRQLSAVATRPRGRRSAASPEDRSTTAERRPVRRMPSWRTLAATLENPRRHLADVELRVDDVAARCRGASRGGRQFRFDAGRRVGLLDQSRLNPRGVMRMMSHSSFFTDSPPASRLYRVLLNPLRHTVWPDWTSIWN